MTAKTICARCKGEIYRHQGVAHYGHYIAHRIPEDCTEYLERQIEVLKEWRSIAQRLGETWGGSVGPSGYYDMTPEQWLEWMNDALEKREWDAQ